jgi:hypothetical protein
MLDNLPKDLQRTYDNAIERINSQNEERKSIAHLALMWVMNAKRPLSIQKLREALSITPGSTHLEEDCMVDIEVIISVCVGLVITDTTLSTVHLVHYTAQEHLGTIM